MRYVIKTVVLVILMCVVASGIALAVGMEKYDVSGTPDPSNKVIKYGSNNVYGAIKDASMTDKLPAALDEIAFFVKDILGQFGLADGNSEQQ